MKVHMCALLMSFKIISNNKAGERSQFWVPLSNGVQESLPLMLFFLLILHLYLPLQVSTEDHEFGVAAHSSHRKSCLSMSVQGGRGGAGSSRCVRLQLMHPRLERPRPRASQCVPGPRHGGRGC